MNYFLTSVLPKLLYFAFGFLTAASLLPGVKVPHWILALAWVAWILVAVVELIAWNLARGDR